MTFEQLHKRFDEATDKVGSDGFQPRRIDGLLNEAIEEKVSEWVLLFETSNAARLALSRLMRPAETGSGKRVVLDSIKGMGRVIALNARWAGGSRNKYVPVGPVRTETIAKREQSWIHRATDTDPYYTEFTDQAVINGAVVQTRMLVIEGETDPEGWQLFYTAIPQVIDKWEKPGTEWMDFPPSAENAIIATAARIAFAQVGETGQYQLSSAEMRNQTDPQLRM